MTFGTELAGALNKTSLRAIFGPYIEARGRRLHGAPSREKNSAQDADG